MHAWVRGCVCVWFIDSFIYWIRNNWIFGYFVLYSYMHLPQYVVIPLQFFSSRQRLQSTVMWQYSICHYCLFVPNGDHDVSPGRFYHWLFLGLRYLMLSQILHCTCKSNLELKLYVFYFKKNWQMNMQMHLYIHVYIYTRTSQCSETLMGL